MEFICLIVGTIVGAGIGLIPFFVKKQKVKEKNEKLE